MTVFDTGGPQGPPPTSSSAPAVSPLNLLDRLRGLIDSARGFVLAVIEHEADAEIPVCAMCRNCANDALHELDAALAALAVVDGGGHDG